MNTALTLSQAPICPTNIDEARSYLHHRFLYKQTYPTKLFVDTKDNQRDLQKGAVIGIIATKFGLGFGTASDVVSNARLRFWSGLEIYAPNEPQVVLHNDKHHLNLWKPSSIKPSSETDPTPFLEHLTLALSSSEEVEFVLDFISYRYQNPKPINKPHHALYLYSDQQGQGKSLFKDTLEKIFGRSAVRMSSNVRELTGQSSFQFWGRTLLFVEEVQVGADTRLYDAIKAMSGADLVDADPKHRDSIEVKVPAQLIMLSNRTPLFLEENDRRFFVAEWDTGLRGEAKEDYFERYITWLQNGGYEAIAGFLANRDLSEYKLTAHAPLTASKMKCLDDAVPLPVQELIELLDANTSTWVFTYTDLKDSLDKIPTQFQADYLEKAGLYKVRKATSDSRPVFYCRVGCHIHKQNGMWVCSLKDNCLPLKTVLYSYLG